MVFSGLFIEKANHEKPTRTYPITALALQKWGIATEEEVRQLLAYLQSGEDTAHVEAIINEGLLDFEIPYTLDQFAYAKS